jgi:uncharacterized membrane protein
MNTKLLIASAIAATVSGAAITAAQAASPAAPSAPGVAAPASPGAPAAEQPTAAQIKAGITVLGKPPARPAFMAEKCYGISAAGLNDCAARPAHTCAGLAKVDRDPFSWIYVPVGYCERLAGGKMTAPSA